MCLCIMSRIGGLGQSQAWGALRVCIGSNGFLVSWEVPRFPLKGVVVSGSPSYLVVAGQSIEAMLFS